MKITMNINEIITRTKYITANILSGVARGAAAAVGSGAAVVLIGGLL